MVFCNKEMKDYINIIDYLLLKHNRLKFMEHSLNIVRYKDSYFSINTIDDSQETILNKLNALLTYIYKKFYDKIIIRDLGEFKKIYYDSGFFYLETSKDSFLFDSLIEVNLSFL